MLSFDMQMDGLMRTLEECQRRNLDMGHRKIKRIYINK